MRSIRKLVLNEIDGQILRLRILAKVETVTPDEGVVVPGPCWLYTGHWADAKGYRKIKWMGRSVYVHRALWTAVHGTIPDGLVLDHKCRQHSCCNPDHMEPVTVAENTQRGLGSWFKFFKVNLTHA